MADVSLLMGMGIVGDLPQIQGEMQKIGSILKQNPVEIQIQAAGIDLSSSSNEAKAFFDMVSSVEKRPFYPDPLDLSYYFPCWHSKN